MFSALWSTPSPIAHTSHTVQCGFSNSWDTVGSHLHLGGAGELSEGNGLGETESDALRLDNKPGLQS